jgi:hypothetical protein
MTIGSLLPFAYAFNEPHSRESSATTNRPSGETLNGRIFDVSIILASPSIFVDAIDEECSASGRLTGQ